MKQLFLNLFCFMLALISGISLFVLKYHVKELEETLKVTHREILQTKRDIHMLEVEWAHLNDPAILLDIVQKHTNWEIISPKQISILSDIPMKPVLLPAEPEVVSEQKKEDGAKTVEKKTIKEKIKVAVSTSKTKPTVLQQSSKKGTKTKEVTKQNNNKKESFSLKKGTEALSSLKERRK